MTFYSNPKRDYVLNPRGKALYDDANRFGTKMLEKMGWSKGKGLGANLDGQLEFIKVSHKGDQKGVGFKDRDDQWTTHESNFNSLLTSFKSAENSDEDSQDCAVQHFQSDDKPAKRKKGNVYENEELFSGVSLEEQSKNSRARVHYKKFTRGKDLSRYSEKDLANIFGKKSLKTDVAAESSSSGSNDDEQFEKSSENIPNFGITTIATGQTISDYFKNKMKNANNSNESKPSDEQVDNVSFSSKEEKKRRKETKTLGSALRNSETNAENSAVGLDQSEEQHSSVRKSKKDKKNRKKSKVLECVEPETNEMQREETVAQEHHETKNVNTFIDSKPSSEQVDNVSFSKREEKKRRKETKTFESSLPNIETNIENSVAGTEQSIHGKKDKKNRKKSKALESAEPEPNEMISEENVVQEHLEQLSVKERKRKQSIDITEETKSIRENNSIDLIDEPLEKKKTKKEKTPNVCDTAVDEPLKIEENSSIVNEEESHRPKKRRNRNKGEVIESQSSEKIDANPNGLHNSEVQSHEKKSKKKRQHLETVTCDEQSTNLFEARSFNDEIQPEVVTDNVYEIRRFRTEIFRYVDLHAFLGSSLCDIPGYGYTNEMTLKIIDKGDDNRLINSMWNDAQDKYANGKKKKKKFVEHIEQLKKKNVFKI